MIYNRWLIIVVNIQSNFLEDKFNLSRGIRLSLYALAVSRPPLNALRYQVIRLCHAVSD